MNRRDFFVGAAALAVAPEALAGRSGGTPTALVTADLESHVVAVDVWAGRVIRRIRTPPGPRAIETVANDAVVAHTEHGLVSLIDGARMRVRAVLEGFAEPRYTVASREHAFVTDSRTGELVVVDVPVARIVGRVDLGGAARHLSLEPSGRVVWAVLGNKADRIAVVDVRDPRRPRLIRRFAPPFLAHDIGFGPGRVWVTGGDARELVLYDAHGKTRRLPADAPPQHVTFMGPFAFVASGDSGTLRVYDKRTAQLIRTSVIPLGSFNVQHTFAGLVLAPSLSRGTLYVGDRIGRRVRRMHVARSSHDACLVMTP